MAAPAYLKLLPQGSDPTSNLDDFLEMLARRMGMIKRGQELDSERAAVYFVRWWRQEGSLLAASSALKVGQTPELNCGFPITQGWGFDFEWQVAPGDIPLNEYGRARFLQDRMEACIDEYLLKMEQEDTEENNVSDTQIKKQQVLQEKMRRKQKHSKR